MSFQQLSHSVKCVSFTVVSGTLVMLASAIHKVVKYYHRP